MNTNPIPPSRRLGQRLVSSARACLTVSPSSRFFVKAIQSLCLGAMLCGGLAVQSAFGDVIFTRSTGVGELKRALPELKITD